MTRYRTGRAVYSPLVPAFWLAGAAAAGPLTPPGGPVTPTGKPLAEVEPRTAISATGTPGDADSVFRITQPGSYYLTGNISGVAAKHAIEIAANSVTIDLMGFEVAGVPGALDGISTAGVARSRITILNGVVRAFGGDGIDLAASSATRVSGVIAAQNSGAGIAAESGALLESCIADGNGDAGFRSGGDSRIVNCVARFNTGDGFSPAGIGGAAYEGCVADSNGQSGFHGFGSCTFNNCTARANAAYGFFVDQEGCSITNCAANSNGADGILILGGIVTDCYCRANAGHGIELFVGVVSRCDCAFNTLNGIQCSTGCLITHNRCQANGSGLGDGAGINALGVDNHIEANNCGQNDRGIDVDGPGNIIVRNTCSGNSINWTIAANNVFGPIIDRTAPGSPAVSGNAAASTLGTTEPNANFSY